MFMKNYERDEEFFYLIYMRIDQKRPNLFWRHRTY